jgi:hypothetical protein
MYSPQGIPSEILTGIIKEAKETYPADYKMQLYTMKNQVEAYQDVKMYSPQGIPSEILDRDYQRGKRNISG